MVMWGENCEKTTENCEIFIDFQIYHYVYHWIFPYSEICTDAVIVYIFLSTDKTIALSIGDGLPSNFWKNIEVIPT